VRALVIKMSSMGDVLHTLPALTDASANIPGIRFDWVVEAGFAPIPAWHPAVDRVVPVSLRRWRKHPRLWLGPEVRNSIREVRQNQYDHVIDAQGLLKSAVIARLARGHSRAGYASDSARESMAALAYSHRATVPGGLHAIERTRRLFARALGYEYPHTPPGYGIIKDDFPPSGPCTPPYLVFNHASTWETKSWPVPYWQQLMEFAGTSGYRVFLPWGNTAERERATRLTLGHDHVELLPRMELDSLAAVLAHATAVVSVDTGLGHLTAALGTPGVSIYGATDPALTGTTGERQHHLKARFDCSPCFNRQCTYTGPGVVTPACYATVSPDQVWGTLRVCINRGME
jgi:heptosyltransferase-1